MPNSQGMDMIDFAMAVFMGNAVTIAFAWGFHQFHKYDYKAPWVAYAAFLIPLFMLAASLYLTGEHPPQFDALAPQQSADLDQ